jgi:hypothetical protein
LFAYRLAKDLGHPLETILDMTVAEFEGWAAFYKIELDEMKKAMNKRSR